MLGGFIVAGALLGNVPLALIIVGVTLVNLAAGTLERGRELYEIVPNLVRLAIGTLMGVSGAAIFWHGGLRGTELDPEEVEYPRGRPLISLFNVEDQEES